MGPGGRWEAGCGQAETEARARLQKVGMAVRARPLLPRGASLYNKERPVCSRYAPDMFASEFVVCLCECNLDPKMDPRDAL